MVIRDVRDYHLLLSYESFLTFLLKYISNTAKFLVAFLEESFLN